MLILLLACVDVPPGECPDVPATPAVAACFGGPAGVDGETGGRSATATWTGTVAEVGAGFPEACTSSFGGTGSASAWWIRITTADGDAYVGIDTPGTTAPVVGASIAVSGFYQEGDFGPTEASLELDVDGALVAWVGESGEVDTLIVPTSVSLARGDATCTTDDACGTWSAYSLEATVGGDSASIAEGASATIGGLTVTSRALRLAETTDGCPDWFVAYAVVGVGASP